MTLIQWVHIVVEVYHHICAKKYYFISNYDLFNAFGTTTTSIFYSGIYNLSHH